MRFLPCGVSMPVLPPTDEFHLRQQRRRNLHEADAATQDRRGKSCKVADDAAAQGDDEIAALEAQLEQALAQRL